MSEGSFDEHVKSNSNYAQDSFFCDTRESINKTSDVASRETNLKSKIPSFFPPSENLVTRMKKLRETVNQQKMKLNFNKSISSSSEEEYFPTRSLMALSNNHPLKKNQLNTAGDTERLKRLKKIFSTKFNNG